jgi:hypothetical protein
MLNTVIFILADERFSRFKFAVDTSFHELEGATAASRFY